MSDSAWPELEVSTTTTKAPEWGLRTESELHVERLEAKLKSIKKHHEKTYRNSRRPHQDTQPHDLEEPDAEEIQAGQEESDEGLWLLWNNTQNTILSPSEAGLRPDPISTSIATTQPLLGGGPLVVSYGSQGISYRTDRRTQIPKNRTYNNNDSESDSEYDEEEEELRLEQAKAKAKDVDEYLAKDRNRHCRTTCCIIS